MSTRNQRGQVWSLDYTIAFLLFISILLFGLKYLILIINDPGQEILQREAHEVAERMMSSGHPTSWTHIPTTSIVRIGLLTNHRLSEQKLLALQNLDPTDARLKLGTGYPFVLTLVSNSDQIIPLREDCAIGNSSILNFSTSESYSEIRAIAYYWGEQEYLRFNLTTYDADNYHNDSTQSNNLSAFLAALHLYDLVVIEDPYFGAWMDISVARILQDLEEYVRSGGTLILSGNVTTSFLGVNQRTTGSTTHTVETADDLFVLNLSEDIDNMNNIQYGIALDGASNFKTISRYGTGETGIARWTIGDGIVYYVPTFLATYADGYILSHSVALVDTLANITTQNCTLNDVSTSSIEDLITIERFNIYRGEPVRIRLLVWRT